MSTSYVFDTEAIIAYLYKEPGHETISSLLDTVFTGNGEGVLSETNASEVFYLVARFEGTAEETPTTDSLRLADRDIRALNRRGLAIESADWRLTGEIKADGSLSIADATAVALAHEQNATLVIGADDDFDALPVDVACKRFRTEGV
ncbi:PIN domain-containing protein [Halocatena salina]|uniref:PIN domain-containing protein n=1 Tax=Halocatena salina TaxID=2934340 RepID=A0A8T9ZYQ2_9EURY|nr:PIN domain-containing protein [Halocatena salina]UPM41825.1 PIN domain-containing protein [Halocatena salina]